jgi:hypothetical protein
MHSAIAPVSVIPAGFRLVELPETQEATISNRKNPARTLGHIGFSPDGPNVTGFVGRDLPPNTVTPQCVHVGAYSLIVCPHSGQLIKAKAILLFRSAVCPKFPEDAQVLHNSNY